VFKPAQDFHVFVVGPDIRRLVVAWGQAEIPGLKLSGDLGEVFLSSLLDERGNYMEDESENRQGGNQSSPRPNREAFQWLVELLEGNNGGGDCA
jgi:hypothetical protein